ncbi:hypothetical protein NPIL_119441 [Nephila pilipes]|uniref:DUF7041 domain-containing protein n=1 Tax=Nephila pilipes TaxID=299642 RepID=A0A8X6NRR3_NEPPI|nr:hypothetical protein NPIL_119441 [Nephila pilipes]
MPTFWEDDPEFWFYPIEFQFVMAAITNESTKFYAVVAAFSSNALSCVTDIVISPPTVVANKTLKDILPGRIHRV